MRENLDLESRQGMAKEVTFGLESEGKEGSTMARSKHVNTHFITDVVE